MMKRTQIYLEQEQDRRLIRAASRRGITKSEIIRRAVDRELEDDEPTQEEWERAIREIAGCWDPGMSGEEYVERIRDGSWMKRIDRMFGE